MPIECSDILVGGDPLLRCGRVGAAPCSVPVAEHAAAGPEAPDGITRDRVERLALQMLVYAELVDLDGDEFQPSNADSAVASAIQQSSARCSRYRRRPSNAGARALRAKLGARATTRRPEGAALITCLCAWADRSRRCCPCDLGACARVAIACGACAQQASSCADVASAELVTSAPATGGAHASTRPKQTTSTRSRWRMRKRGTTFN
jgi:hypothetical protein